MLVRIVGLGPGDPQLLTLGSIEALRKIGRAVTLLAPPDLTKYLSGQGITIVRDLVDDPALFVRGGSEEIERFVERVVLRQAQDDKRQAQDDKRQDTAARHGELVEPRANGVATDLGLGVLGNPLSDFPGLPPLLRALEKRSIRTEIVPGMPRATLSAAITMPLIPLPPASAHHSWDDLIEIMARLRASCPWDREQTHRTLVPYLIEETYEVVEAIEQNDEAALCEELGDLLLQVVFHAQLGSETGRFTIADVVDALSNKMVRRHPHVFGDAVIEDVDAQWKNWERLKSQEATGQKRKSRLDGIPKHLGALQRGQRMQEKASRVGFDWPAVRDILDKLQEELTELAEAQREKQDDPHVREELGDVFFTLVNLSRAMGIDAETAMREANDKFYKRFSFMEERAAKEGKALSDMSIDELEELWQLAKTQAA
jgi:tetrapyrrole methylase family protein/MazG family protein